MQDMVPVSTEGFVLSEAGKEKAHFTIVENIYFQRPNGRTMPLVHTYARFVDSDEQEYSREVKLTEEWTKLDTGWICNTGLLHIANTPDKFKTQPTEDQRQAAAMKVVEIAFATQHDGKPRDMHSPKRPPITADLFVLPGETTRIHPVDTKTIFLRSQSGITKCVITVLPS